MRIVELKAQNVMGLQACDLTPEPHLNIVGGKNGAGKSSLLNAITAALAGKGSMPAEPLRRGEQRGEIVARLDAPDGDLIIKRKISGDGKTSLTIESEKGAKYGKPQQMLDALVGAVGFDPAAFCRLDPKRQAEQLRELVGLDLSDLDAERQRAYEQRTQVNREVKRLEGVVSDSPVRDDLPAEEVSIADLTRELETAQEHNRTVGSARSAVQQTERRIGEIARETKRQAERVERLRADLTEAESILSGLEAQRQRADSTLEEQQAALAEMTEIECGPILQRITESQQTNAAIRANQVARETQKRLSDCRASADMLTACIGDIDEQKRERLAAANWPIDGLGFADGVVTFNGIPFDQCSSAEQLRVSLAMGMATNPDLRVLMIRDGSLMDDDTLAVVRELAEQHDFQVWIERVSSTGEGCSIVVTEGVATEVPA